VARGGDASPRRTARVLVCQPFPGPPRPDGRVYAAGAEPDAGSIPALRFRTITTRYFLIDRNRLGERTTASPSGPIRRF
jgi:hypothetical protein